MADRVFKRVLVNIEAEIISSSVSYPAFIRNISEYGIHAKIANPEHRRFSKSEAAVDLKFQLPTGEPVYLLCRKKWAYKNTSNSFIENVGIEIIDPPDEYRNFFRVISHDRHAGL